MVGGYCWYCLLLLRARDVSVGNKKKDDDL